MGKITTPRAPANKEGQIPTTELTKPQIHEAGGEIPLCLTADLTAHPPAWQSGHPTPSPGRTQPQAAGRSLPAQGDGGQDAKTFVFAGVCPPRSSTARLARPRHTAPAHSSPWEMLPGDAERSETGGN